MAKVSLLVTPPIGPAHMASHAGRECYEPDAPSLDDGKQIDVQKRLFNPGHHTTLQHAPHYYPFQIEDISVSTITFGFHLNHPFYNSDQRSGRFSKMYDNPDLSELESRLGKYFPNKNLAMAMDFIETGINIFQKNKDSLTDIAATQLRKERPNVTDKYIENNAKKMAQEQLRVFMSMIMPTGMVHTINLTTLAALWRVAWTPEMRDVVTQMKDAVLQKNPDIAYMFDETTECVKNECIFLDNNVANVKTSPLSKLIYADTFSTFLPQAKDTVDILQFSPHAMENNVRGLVQQVEMSAMTMGQDQRHRTIGRSKPEFTGNFYLPPLLKIAGLEKDAKDFMKYWIDLPYDLDLKNFITPYGAMVRYEKRENYNALLHEMAKRLCWCAQEEIYNMNIQLVNQLKMAGQNNLVNEILPPCAKGGCVEGVRYCGRDLNIWKNHPKMGLKQRGV